MVDNRFLEKNTYNNPIQQELVEQVNSRRCVAFVGGGSIAVPVSVAFGGKELIERYSCSDKLRLPSRWFVQAVKGASCYGVLIHVTPNAS
jgi:hypothetical protein